VIVEIRCPSLHDEFEVESGEMKRKESGKWGMRLCLVVNSLQTLI
jgi:nitrite reductase/ring-hydroxylating ferredoxin subunit